MTIKKEKCVNFNDMHPMQIQAIMDLLHMSVGLAGVIDEEECLRDVESYCDELVRLFGGEGFHIELDGKPISHSTEVYGRFPH